MLRTFGVVILVATMAVRAIGQPVAPDVSHLLPTSLARVVSLDETGQFVGEGPEVIRALIQDMRTAEQSNGSITVLFVHGWRTDADPANEGYEELLNLLDRKEKSSLAPRTVLGLYVTWPATGNLGSFWSKKYTADTISDAGKFSWILSSLADVHQKQRELKSDSRSRLFLIGHSFGARMLFAATSQAIIYEVQHGSAADDPSGNYVSVVLRGFGDLIVLVNPAFEAGRYTAINEYSRSREGFRSEQPPLLLTVSASDDKMTQVPWKAASHLDYFAPKDIRYTTTLGNYRLYRTHRLEPCSGSDADCFGLAGLVQEPGQRSGLNNPFIVATADARILSGHSGSSHRVLAPPFGTFLVEYFCDVDKRINQSSH
jgi:hypothetical protein